jgi:hypothetical protein
MTKMEILISKSWRRVQLVITSVKGCVSGLAADGSGNLYVCTEGCILTGNIKELESAATAATGTGTTGTSV